MGETRHDGRRAITSVATGLAVAAVLLSADVHINL